MKQKIKFGEGGYLVYAQTIDGGYIGGIKGPVFDFERAKKVATNLIKNEKKV